MDTIHDLGGREGFGPIFYDKDDDAIPFHSDWEARAFAICYIIWGKWKKCSGVLWCGLPFITMERMFKNN